LEDDFHVDDFLGSDEDFQGKALQEDEHCPEVDAILDALNNDDEFNSELEGLIASIQDQTLDLSHLQSSMILLIKAALEKMSGRDKEKIKAILKSKERKITEHIAAISTLLLHKKSKIVQVATQGINKPKDQYSHLTVDSRNNLRQVMRRFAIYEVYKIMNPHQIAGETRKDNFIHNVIAGGLKRAMKYEGGTKEEIAAYSPKFIKSLEKQHDRFKRGGAKGVMI